jgi:glycosyltransferase involved in cell wall biosynthesis
VSEWLSVFPLLPPRSRVNEPISYYIDATLQQNFDEYAYRIGHRTRRDALAREQEAYDEAGHIVCFTEWCARSVTDLYGISRERVRVILPGANLEDDLVPPPAQWDGTFRPLRLAFIGLDWRRKGLPELLDSATILARRGHAVEVLAIGPHASQLPSHPALRPLGFLDKRRDLAQFVNIVRTCHFGCLLSRVDASPIALLECLRLGIPVIGTDVGGIHELIPAGAGLVVSRERSGEHLADVLDAVLSAPDRYAAFRRAAAQAAPHLTWDRAARELAAVLGS